MKRSMLFTPANNAGNVMNADAMPADRIILDLEDAVSVEEKDAARILAYHALKSMHFKKDVIIRINAVDTPFWQDDIRTVVPAAPQFLMTPKINGAADILLLDQFTAETERRSGLEIGGIQFIPIIETALGVEKSFEIATASSRVAALFLGASDLANDLHATRIPSGEDIAYARSRILIAARAAGIDAYDTPWALNIHDFDGARTDALVAKQLGFTGKAAIYPEHAVIFNEVFSPTPAEIEHALGVLEAIDEARRLGKGVVTFRGEMIDAPMVKSAQQVVEMANEMKGGGLR